MGMALGDLRLTKAEIDLGTPSWAGALRTFELPRDLLRHADHSLFHLLVARDDGETVATALAALTALQLHNAVARGCATASLQATKIAEGMYAAVGFRDLGRILEYVPATAPSTR